MFSVIREELEKFMNGQERKWMDRQSIKAGKKLIAKGWNDFEDAMPEVLDRGLAPLKGMTRIWKNNLYIVQEFPKSEGMTLLMVRRNDAAPIRSWSDMQRIKNELMGEDRVAVEVYPAESDLIDLANMYHLWVFQEGYKLPFGLHLK